MLVKVGTCIGIRIMSHDRLSYDGNSYTHKRYFHIAKDHGFWTYTLINSSFIEYIFSGRIPYPPFRYEGYIHIVNLESAIAISSQDISPFDWWAWLSILLPHEDKHNDVRTWKNICSTGHLSPLDSRDNGGSNAVFMFSSLLAWIIFWIIYMPLHCSVPNHYANQSWLIITGHLVDKFQ